MGGFKVWLRRDSQECFSGSFCRLEFLRAVVVFGVTLLSSEAPQSVHFSFETGMQVITRNPIRYP